MKKLILFLLLSINDWILVNSLYTCPSGDEIKGDCNEEDGCANKNHYCFQFESTFYTYCCDKRKRFCDENMISFPGFDGKKVLRKDKEIDKDYWYETTVKVDGEDEKHWCPIPVSWQLVHPDHTAINYDLLDPMIECSKNRDCKKGQFCGHTLNESFRNGYGKMTDGRNEWDAPYANNFLDMSDNGKSMLFCYEVPEEMKDPKYDMDLESVGFTVCENEADCDGVEAECRLDYSVKGYLYFEADGRPTEVTDEKRPKRPYNGICLYKDGIVVKPKPPPTEDPAPEDPATEAPATEDTAPKDPPSEAAAETSDETSGSTILSMLMIKLVLLVFYLTQ